MANNQASCVLNQRQPKREMKTQIVLHSFEEPNFAVRPLLPRITPVLQLHQPQAGPKTTWLPGPQLEKTPLSRPPWLGASSEEQSFDALSATVDAANHNPFRHLP